MSECTKCQCEKCRQEREDRHLRERIERIRNNCANGIHDGVKIGESREYAMRTNYGDGVAATYGNELHLRMKCRHCGHEWTYIRR